MKTSPSKLAANRLLIVKPRPSTPPGHLLGRLSHVLDMIYPFYSSVTLQGYPRLIKCLHGIESGLELDEFCEVTQRYTVSNIGLKKYRNFQIVDE